MKKIYISPRLFVLDVEPSEMLKGSKYTMGEGIQWGGEGEYMPSDWKNEGFMDKSEKVGGFDAVEIIEDTDDELWSR